MSPKFRKYLILAHLWLAGLMAPAFALHAISGGLYLLDVEGRVSTERVALPAGAALNFKSETLEADIRALLKMANLKHEFEYVRVRGSGVRLGPTSKTYLEFKQISQGLSATRFKPDTVRSMMELHKGHGPQAFKTYQKFVAFLLLAVVLGGISVGLISKAYRTQTGVAVVLGVVAFIVVGFVI